MAQTRCLALLILWVAIAGSGGVAAAGVKTGAIVGTVVDAHGRPVKDATVTMQTSYGQSPSATHTDANGRFTFARYATGQYDLQAYWRGMFSDWKKRVVIRSGKATEITLRLPPAADITVPVSN